MGVKITFGVEVELDEHPGWSDEDYVNFAREIMYSAPAFDDISEERIASMDMESIEWTENNE
jgi:hypothetical protein